MSMSLYVVSPILSKANSFTSSNLTSERVDAGERQCYRWKRKETAVGTRRMARKSSQYFRSYGSASTSEAMAATMVNEAFPSVCVFKSHLTFDKYPTS